MFNIIFIDGEKLAAEISHPSTEEAPTPQQVDSVRLLQKLGNDLSDDGDGNDWVEAKSPPESGEDNGFQPLIEYGGQIMVRANIARTDKGPTGRDGYYIFPIADPGAAIDQPVDDYEWTKISDSAMGGVRKSA